MNNFITKWWLSLEPATQYMYWIISFCAMLATGIGLVVLVAGSEYSATLLMPILLGIGMFVIFFLLIVLWLTVRYPHMREK